MWQVFERIMNAVTFAEAGEPETALSLLHGEGKESKSADNAERKRVGISERAQQYMSAVTFAEEGEHQYAREALEETAPTARPAEAKCILVLGNEDTFVTLSFPREAHEGFIPLSAYAVDPAGKRLEKPALLSIHYFDDDLPPGASEEDIALVELVKDQWFPLGDYEVDTFNNITKTKT